MLLGLIVALPYMALRATYAPYRPTAALHLPSSPTQAPQLPLLRATAFLITVDGVPLAGANAHLLHPTASTIKLLTALVAVKDPNLPLSRVITMTPQDVQAANAGYAQGDSVLQVTAGEQLTVHDLLLALLLPSADNAADILAASSTGGTKGFLLAMHQEAQRLGLGSPAFGDPSGLSQQDQLSPSGAVRLAQAALSNPTISGIVRLQTAQLSNGQVLHNLNQLLGTYPGAIGLKTGFTPAAGYMLVFAAKRGSHTAIGSLMGEPSMPQLFSDASSLLNWSFAVAPSRTLPAGLEVGTLHWPGGATQVLRLSQSVILPLSGAGPLSYRLRLAPAAQLAAGSAPGSLVISDGPGGPIAAALRTTALGAWPRLLALLFH